MAHYHLGREDEYAIIRMAEDAGHLVVRAAGSKGSADVIVFTAGATFALNVKRGDWAPPADRLVMARWLDHNVWPVLARCDSGPGRRRQWSFRDVGSDGSMAMPSHQPPWLEGDP